MVRKLDPGETYWEITPAELDEIELLAQKAKEPMVPYRTNETELSRAKAALLTVSVHMNGIIKLCQRIKGEGA